MIRVIGVRFRSAGKVYYFDPGDNSPRRGDHVIVETSRGIEYGTVVTPPQDLEEGSNIKPLRTIVRMATEHDISQERTSREKEKEAYRVCQEKIRSRKLEMKLIAAEYTFDGSKVLFYFTADGRIDFRELVKDLASVLHTRIELRQIGVRDEAKIIGGYGICGRPLCCHMYLSDFAPVSIKMAKEQSLSLNPTKISGVCGRLMCCLKNEEEVYEEVNKRMPRVGDVVATDDGLEGEVASTNVLRETLRVMIESADGREVKEYPVDQVHFLHKKVKHKNPPKQEAPEGGKGGRRGRGDRNQAAGAAPAGDGAQAAQGASENGTGVEKNSDRPRRNCRNDRGNGQPRDGQNQNRDGQNEENRGGQNRDGQQREGRDGQNREGRRNGRGDRGQNRQGRDNRDRQPRDSQQRGAGQQPREAAEGQSRDGQTRNGAQPQNGEGRNGNRRRNNRRRGGRGNGQEGAANGAPAQKTGETNGTNGAGQNS